MSILGDNYSTDEECDECGAEAGDECYSDCPIRVGAAYDLA